MFNVIKKCNKQKITTILTIVSVIIFIIWCIFQIKASYTLDVNFYQHLKRATNANTIDIAREELTYAVSYLEENNLTSGNTSFFLNIPENDIEFWYINLNAALYEFNNIPDDATILEKTNILMKFKKYGENYSQPFGISTYPYQKLYFLVGLISFFSSFILGTYKLGKYLFD